MDIRSTRSVGWLIFSAVALVLGGVFALIDGLMAVYQPSFFASDAVFAFSDLETWGWIIFGLGIAGIVSGVALLSRSESARWLSVFVAGLSALGQLLFAQAYPLYSLMIMSVFGVVIYGLLVHGVREGVESVSASIGETRDITGSADVTDVTARTRRAA